MQTPKDTAQQDKNKKTKVGAAANNTAQQKEAANTSYQINDNRPEAMVQRKLMNVSKDKSYSNSLSTSHQKGNPVQRVANIAAGKGGICGPSVLSGILGSLGKEAKTVAEIKEIALAETGSAVGEIFTWADLKRVTDALGIVAVKRTFTSVETLSAALVATGANPVMAALSNVGFPGKERAAYDQQLIEAGKEWVRAHWIAITAFDAENNRLTYKDNGNDGGAVALTQNLFDNNALTDTTWNWNEWGEESGSAVPENKAGTTEQMDLSGYIVEFTG